MQKLAPFCVAVSTALLLGTHPVLANSITISANTTSSTGEVLTDASESVSVNAGVKLTVTATGVTPAPAILTNSGSLSGVTVTINNLGAIEQSGTGNGIQDANGHETVTITNGSTGNSVASLQADNADAIHLSKSSDIVFVNNYAQILSVTGGQGIDMSGMTSTPAAGGGAGSTTINNYATGLIEGEANDGIQTAVGASVNNDGQITGAGSGSDGINTGVNTGATIVNASAILGDTTGTGSITGAHHGITGGEDVDTADSGFGKAYVLGVTNNTGGTIIGSDGSGINIDGVNSKETVTVVNSGTISGNGVTGDGDGVDVDGLVNITNNATGRILSLNANGDASEGVTVGGGTIVNSGTIEGETSGTSTYARGITLAGIDNTETNKLKTSIAIQSIYADTTVTNTGTIKGDTESGITVLGTTSGAHLVTINNNAGGKILGSNTGVSERGPGPASGASLNQAVIELDDTSNTYVVNESGTITQGTTLTGTAIAMHGFKASGTANTLNITGGAASISGDISGDTAADSVLNINPGAGNSFSYGYNISNFTTFINYNGTTAMATTGTVTLSGASTNAGTTTVEGGTFNVTNTTGSATGTGKVIVNGEATIGGTGIIQPGAGNGLTLSKQSTLVSGGTPSGTTAGKGLTLDNTLAGGAILDASLGSANLTFSLGANHSSTAITVLGTTPGEVKFDATDTITINDLTNGQLVMSLNTPYLLIQAGTVPGLLADNDLYAGLRTTGGTDALGNILNGYVTTPIGITLNGAVQYPELNLYLSNGNLELVPEPSTWAMILGGLGVIGVFQFRRRLRAHAA